MLQGFHLDRGGKSFSDIGEPKSLPSEEDSCSEEQ